MNRHFKNNRLKNKKVNIVIQKTENSQWCAEFDELDPPIQKINSNREKAVDLAKAEVCERYSKLFEVSKIKFENIQFKVYDKTNSYLQTRQWRKKISKYWKIIVNWYRVNPFFDSFIEAILWSLLTWPIILLMALFIIILLTVRALEPQSFIPVLTSLSAFLTGVIVCLGNSGVTLHKSKLDRQQEAINNVKENYENAIKIINNPGFYSSEKIKNLINNFDNKNLYLSPNIYCLWSEVKELIVVVQINQLNIDEDNFLCKFRNFIVSLRKEMGYSSSSGVRAALYKDLKRKYQNFFNSLS